MILRLVRGHIRHGRLDRVVAAYTTTYQPAALRTAGLDRFLVATRALEAGQGHQVATMTLWSSVEAALEAYGGDLSALRTLDSASHGEDLTQVDYYEVEESAIRRDGVDPAILRLTAGTVARGLDADIQQELRRRLPGLPGALAEGYIGRRVLGDVVEIAFVSTWSATPTESPLEAPLWPDISSRYDTFSVEVYDVVLAGSPG